MAPMKQAEDTWPLAFSASLSPSCECENTLFYVLQEKELCQHQGATTVRLPFMANGSQSDSNE